MNHLEVIIGIDVGTQGVRILAVDRLGNLIASSSKPFSFADRAAQPPGWHGQNPDMWWEHVLFCLRDVSQKLPAGAEVVGIAVDSTSGTVLPVDENGTALYEAIMYNDARSKPYVEDVRDAGKEQENRLGYAFSASFALPKIFWLMKERPEIFRNTWKFVHAADYIAGKLTGDFSVSDHSNALKTGYDLQNKRWPDFIENKLAIPLEKLPRVVKPGDKMGVVSSEGAESCGLQAGIPVFGGATDGTAAQIASGAVSPGSWLSSLGTTLVVKGITENILIDPHKRIYCHLHPEGYWMPGGASNTGSEWIIKEYSQEDPAELDKLAASLLPTSIVRYPLARPGERFPFRSADAQGFTLGQADDRLAMFAAGLEGLALLEKLAYDTLTQIGADVGEKIYVTDGGAKSKLWLKVRASMLKRVLVRPVLSESAMGAAILAASGAWYGSLSAAAANMVQQDIAVEPDEAWVEVYQEKYEVFAFELVKRGYILAG